MTPKEKAKTEDEKIIEDFIKSKKLMEKFIQEELQSMKSPLRERLRNEGICA